MYAKATPVEVEVTLRNIPEGMAIKDYTIETLDGTVHSLPNLRSATVEITFEHTRPKNQRYVVQATLESNGTLLRAEDRGPNPNAAVDSVRALLERRIRDWQGRVYYQRRRESAAHQEALEEEASRLPREEHSGQIVRIKSHEIKPQFPEDAVEQMELLGHDFFFFLNAGTGQYNVVYRRKAGGYGLIEPYSAAGEKPR